MNYLNNLLAGVSVNLYKAEMDFISDYLKVNMPNKRIISDGTDGKLVLCKIR